MAASRPDEAGPSNDPRRTGWAPPAAPSNQRGYATARPAPGYPSRVSGAAPGYPGRPSGAAPGYPAHRSGAAPGYSASPPGDFVDPNLQPSDTATPYSSAPPFASASYSPAPPGYGYPVGPYPSPNPYGYVARGSGRPGTLTAASVLAYVQAGLLLIAMLMLFYGASILNNFDDGSAVTSELVVDGVVNALLAGLFIWGGVAMSLRQPAGRLLITTAGALCVIDGSYWMMRFPSAVVAFYMILFIALPAIAAGLAWSAVASSWLTAEPGRP
jgi:hypothetical protein